MVMKEFYPPGWEPKQRREIPWVPLCITFFVVGAGIAVLGGLLLNHGSSLHTQKMGEASSCVLMKTYDQHPTQAQNDACDSAGQSGVAIEYVGLVTIVLGLAVALAAPGILIVRRYI